MNTPSPGLLRKALKIVDEIEKLDQQMHHLLSDLELKEAGLTSITEEARSYLSQAAPTPKEKKVKIFQEKMTPSVAAEEISENKSPLPPTPVVPQHEQQSLLMEETGIEQLVIIESGPSEIKEESGGQHDEQSCCLF